MVSNPSFLRTQEFEDAESTLKTFSKDVNFLLHKLAELVKSTKVINTELKHLSLDNLS